MEPRSKHQEESAHCDAISGSGDRLLMQVGFSCSHWEIVSLFGNPIPSTLEMETKQFLYMSTSKLFLTGTSIINLLWNQMSELLDHILMIDVIIL